MNPARGPKSGNARATRKALQLIMSVAMIGACTSSGHKVAENGRHALVGLKGDDLQACAGIPNRTKRLDEHTELFSYELKNENVGGMQVSIPLLGGGFKFAGSGSYCHAVFRVIDGKVAAIAYTGDDDDFAGQNGVCAPIVRGCLRALAENGGSVPQASSLAAANGAPGPEQPPR
jgi:hypothetical protein